MQTKKHIIETKLLPSFGGKRVNDIRPADVIQWQNEMSGCRDEKGNPYSEIYLKTLHNQPSAILNHAVLLLLEMDGNLCYTDQNPSTKEVGGIYKTCRR